MPSSNTPYISRHQLGQVVQAGLREGVVERREPGDGDFDVRVFGPHAIGQRMGGGHRLWHFLGIFLRQRQIDVDGRRARIRRDQPVNQQRLGERDITHALQIRRREPVWVAYRVLDGKVVAFGVAVLEIRERIDAGHVKPSCCPLCGSTEKVRPVPSGKPLPYWCGACRRNFSIKTGTVMHRSHIGLQKWTIAIYLWSVSLKGVSSMRLHRDLKITQKSAYFMAQRLREAWSESLTDMAGPLEVDETFVGGRERNKHSKKKLRAGRGGIGKAIVAGAKDRATGKVGAKVVKETDAKTLQGFVMNHAEPGATVYTDDHSAYKGMPFEHETVKHSVSEYVRAQAHTNGIESFWATMKRGYHGTFHHISPKHLHRYVNEFAARHNMRPKDTEAMMSETVARMVGKRLMYKELVAGQGHRRVGERAVSHAW